MSDETLLYGSSVGLRSNDVSVVSSSAIGFRNCPISDRVLWFGDGIGRDERRTLVYRVESFAGKGAYATGVGCPGGGNLGQHPCPTEDKGLREKWNWLSEERYQYYFGFDSITQLIGWFPVEHWNGFIRFNDTYDKTPEMKVGISIYECLPEDVIVGDKQTVFIKERAERVKILEFGDYALLHTQHNK